MDPLGDLVKTRPIGMGWEIPIEWCLIGRFRCIANPDRQIVNGKDPTRTRIWSDGPEPLLTLGMCKKRIILLLASSGHCLKGSMS